MSDVGTFRTTVEIESYVSPGVVHELPNTLVDTGSEATWVPRPILELLGVKRVKTVHFRVADGRTVDRDVGYAIVHAGGTQTVDEVVFAERGDMILLGARTMEGLNLRVDPKRKQLVDAGPVDAGASGRAILVA